MGAKRAGKLLLVEDEHVLRGLIAQFLRGECFEVVEAADGAEGVGLFSSRGPFDLILLDLNLPIFSGVEVCRRVKSLVPTQPILICSAAILDFHVCALREMQVDQFLTKPYHPLDLLGRITIELARGARTEAAEVSRPIRPRLRRSDAPPAVMPSSRTLVNAPLLD
jgi:two-component system response regulator VanR